MPNRFAPDFAGPTPPAPCPDLRAEIIEQFTNGYIVATRKTFRTVDFARATESKMNAVDAVTLFGQLQ